MKTKGQKLAEMRKKMIEKKRKGMVKKMPKYA